MIAKANRMICLKSRLNAVQLILDCRWSCAKFKGCWCCKKWVIKTVRQSPRLYQANYKAQHMSCFFSHLWESTFLKVWS